MIGNLKAANETWEQAIVDRDVRRSLERAAAERAEAKDYGQFRHGPLGRIERLYSVTLAFTGYPVTITFASKEELDNLIRRTEKYYGPCDTTIENVSTYSAALARMV